MSHQSSAGNTDRPGHWKLEITDELSAEQVIEIIQFFTYDVTVDDRRSRFGGVISNDALAENLRSMLPAAAIVARAICPCGLIVGVGESYGTEVRYSDASTGGAMRSFAYEIACVAASTLQRRGIGLQIVQSLMRLSAKRGVQTFHFVAQANNYAAVSLIRSIVSKVEPALLHVAQDCDTIEATIEIDASRMEDLSDSRDRLQHLSDPHECPPCHGARLLPEQRLSQRRERQAVAGMKQP